MKELEYTETATKLRLMRKTKGTYIAVSASFSGCGGSRNRIDTAFSPTGLYKSLFYAEEMQV